MNKDIVELDVAKRFVFKNNSFEFCRVLHPYMDLLIDYVFDELELEEEIELSEKQTHFINSVKHMRRALRRKHKGKEIKLTKFGIGPYGNLFYLDSEHDIYFYDHERASLVVSGINIKELIF